MFLSVPKYLIDGIKSELIQWDNRVPTKHKENWGFPLNAYLVKNYMLQKPMATLISIQEILIHV